MKNELEKERFDVFKTLLNALILKGQKPKVLLESIINMISLNFDRAKNVAYLKALFEERHISFSDILSEMNKPRDLIQSWRVREFVISCIGSSLSLEENFQLAELKEYRAELFGTIVQSIGVENFSPEQVENFLNFINPIKAENEEDLHALDCLTHQTSDKLDWESIYKKFGWKKCIELCKILDKDRDNVFIWTKLFYSLVIKIKESNRKNFIETINCSTGWIYYIQSKKLSNEEIVNICKSKKIKDLWNDAKNSIKWEELSIEKILKIESEMFVLSSSDWINIINNKKRRISNLEVLQILEQERDRDLWNSCIEKLDWMSLDLEQQSKIKTSAQAKEISTAKIEKLVEDSKLEFKLKSITIKKINDSGDSKLLEKALQRKLFTFEELLEIDPKKVRDTDVLFIKHLNITTEDQLKKLTEKKLIYFDQWTIENVKTFLLLAYVAKNARNCFLTSIMDQIGKKLSATKIAVQEIIESLQIFISMNNEFINRTLENSIPWKNYSAEEILKICEAVNNEPRILSSALEKLAEKASK